MPMCAVVSLEIRKVKRSGTARLCLESCSHAGLLSKCGRYWKGLVLEGEIENVISYHMLWE